VNDNANVSHSSFVVCIEEFDDVHDMTEKTSSCEKVGEGDCEIVVEILDEQGLFSCSSMGMMFA